MAFATNADRLALIKSQPTFGVPFAVRIRRNGRESELAADDFDHADTLAMQWKHTHGAEYVEVFRVRESDGALYGGIGAY